MLRGRSGGQPGQEAGHGQLGGWVTSGEAADFFPLIGGDGLVQGSGGRGGRHGGVGGRAIQTQEALFTHGGSIAGQLAPALGEVEDGRGGGRLVLIRGDDWGDDFGIEQFR